MKKILLLMLLLIAFASMLLAEEIDREKIMPKKLIYSELPDDCPKELNELFQFYYDEAQAILHEYKKIRKENNENFVKELWDFLYDRIENMEEEKKFRILYLDWLTRNTIPLYYAEFTALHFNIEFIDSIPESELNAISYMPEEVIELWKNYLRIPWINNFYGLVKNDILNKYPEQSLKFLFYTGHYFWIKGIVLESEYFDRQTSRMGVNKTKNYVKFKIIETICNEFNQDEIIIEIFSNKCKLVSGQLYLIPINCCYYNYQFDDEISFSNQLIGNEPINYGSSIGAIYKLENGMMKEKRRPITSDPSLWITFPFFSDETEISYITFKERIEEAISDIKQRSGMED